MSIEAMKLALEALETAESFDIDAHDGYYLKAIESLRQAIEQAQQAEPVAWIWKYSDDDEEVTLLDPQFFDKDALGITSTTPLYTSPPPRQPLTDEEIDQGLIRTNYAMQTANAWRDGVEWAQSQLKEKNT